MKGFGKIKKWIKNQGYTLKWGKNDFVDYQTKELTLYGGKNRSDIHQIYTALHECGHIVIANKKTYERDYKSLVIADDIDSRHMRSNVYKYKKLREEMMAWEEGYKLATKLGIKLDRHEFDVYSSKYFMTYVKEFGGN